MTNEHFIIILLLIVICINFIPKKEFFTRKHKDKKILLQDNNGNMEVMSLDSIYNSIQEVRDELNAKIEKRGDEWGSHHANLTKKWVNSQFLNKNDHYRIQLSGGHCGNLDSPKHYKTIVNCGSGNKYRTLYVKNGNAHINHSHQVPHRVDHQAYEEVFRIVKV